jgi:hypothetical protein
MKKNPKRNRPAEKKLPDPDTKLSITDKHILILICISILFKVAMIFITLYGAHSFIDYFDITSYIEHGILLMHGNIPYLSFHYEYPILSFIPLIITYIPAMILNSVSLYAIFIQIFMVFADAATAVCVYFIALKIYDNTKTAFTAGIIYAISFCAAYTSLTRFDSFVVFLFVASIACILYEKKSYGYLANATGALSKVFPAVALPYFVIYNKDTWKESVKEIVQIYGLMFIIFIFPFIFIAGYEAIKPYLFATGATVSSVYAGTLTYTIFSWIYYVFKVNITIAQVSTIVTICLAAGIVALVASAYWLKKMKPADLVMYAGITLTLLICLSKFHSPQYYMWITPLFAILVADNINKFFVFFLFQVLTYIEFPIMFGAYYNNLSYTGAFGTYSWYVALIFFTLEYIVIGIMIFMNFSHESNLYDIIKYHSK